MGFTLGAMAIVLAFPSSKLFSLFSENGRPDSYYLDLASKFVHFILVQALAIIFALLAKAYSNCIFSFFGFTLLLYVVACAVMTALALFGVAQLYNESGVTKADDSTSSE